MKNPGDSEPSNGSPADGTIMMTGIALNRLVVPLTVVYAQVQLLKRRIQRGQLVQGADLEQAVTRIDESLRALVAEVHALGEPAAGAGRHDDPEQTHDPGKGRLKDVLER